MHQVKKALEEEHAYYIEGIQVEQQRYEEAYAHHQKEQEYYSMAKRLNEQFEEQSKRQSQLQALLQEQDVYTVKEREIALAEKAERLVLVEQQCIDLRNELNRKEQSYQQALMEQQHAEAQLIVAQEKFNAEEAKEPERQRILQQEIQLQALLPKFEAYEHNLQQMQLAEQYVVTAKQSLADNVALLEKEQQQLQQLTTTIEQYEKQLEPYESYLEQLPKLKEQVSLLAQVEKYTKAVETIEQDVMTANVRNQESKQALQKLEQQWITSQASILAQQLKDGEPCPVCGSTTHLETHLEQLENIELARWKLYG